MNNNITPFMDQAPAASGSSPNGFMTGFATQAVASPFAMNQSPLGANPFFRKRDRDMFPGVSQSMFMIHP